MNNKTISISDNDNNMQKVSNKLTMRFFFRGMKIGIGSESNYKFAIELIENITDYNFKELDADNRIIKFFNSEDSVLKIYYDDKRFPKYLANFLKNQINIEKFLKYLKNVNKNSTILAKKLEKQFGVWKNHTKQNRQYWISSSIYPPIFRVCATLFAELICARSEGKTVIPIEDFSNIEVPKKSDQSKDNDISTFTFSDDAVAEGASSFSPIAFRDVPSDFCSSNSQNANSKHTAPSAVIAGTEFCGHCIHWNGNKAYAKYFPDKVKGNCKLDQKERKFNSPMCEDYEWQPFFNIPNYFK